MQAAKESGRHHPTLKLAASTAPMTKAEKDRREQKNMCLVLSALCAMFAGVLIYGIEVGSVSLSILGFCGTMPTFFALLINLTMYVGYSDKA
jgi:hypothetical protein